MKSPKSPSRIALYTFRVFVGCLVLFYCLYFLGLIAASKHQAVFLGIFSMGVFSIWAGYHYHISKLPIRRGREMGFQISPIEFHKDPGEHKSSVLTFVIIGVVFIILGVNGIFHA